VSAPAELRVVPAEARAFQGEPAGIASRVLANSVDLAITIGILFAIYGAVAAALFLRRGSRFRFPTPTYAHAFILGSLILIVYFVVTWTANGQTYGDRLLGIRVRAPDGGLLHPGLATIRAVICVLFPLLLFWAVVDRRRRSVQDLLVRTSVVYDWKLRADTPT
jgi:uncharacterized RDD family membrane protein YckC